MKKTLLYSFVIVALLPMLVSCKDMLEEVNYGNPTTEDMMSNEENVVLLVGQAYADIKWVHDHWGYFGVSSLTADECLCPVRMPNQDWADGGYWKNLNTHKWNEFAEAFRNIWNTTISGAVLCNKLLNTLSLYKDSMSEAVYLQYVGELEVLRSYYYYLLFDSFGRIPYVEDYEERTEPLMAPELVWSNLVNCLERNAPNMPKVTDGTRANNYGRVTQGFAYGLLARLYLNAESFDCTPENVKLNADNTNYRSDFVQITTVQDFYTNAVKCCDKVISSGSYSIAADYFSNFAINNESSRENIFVIVENGNTDFDLRYNGSMSNKLRMIALTLTYPMQQTWGLIEKPWNGFCARPSFINRYNDKDVRGAGDEGNGTNNQKRWGWFIGPVYDTDGTTVLTYKDSGDPDTQAIITKTITSLDKATNADGARLFKYEIDKDKKYSWAENDFVLMRYADILWMKEEAILRGGEGVSGKDTPDFKRMISRAFCNYDEMNPEADFMAAYPALFSGSNDEKLSAILDERGREFAWELVRRRDLIRFGKFNDDTYVDYVIGKESYRKWFPIPFSVIEKSSRDEVTGEPIWTQNPGY